MEIASALRLMLRDITGLASWFPIGTLVAALTVALPIVSLVLVIRRRLLAIGPLLVALGLYGWWFLYYATDRWPNPGQGVWMGAALVVLIGWTMLAAVFWAHAVDPDDRG